VADKPNEQGTPSYGQRDRWENFAKHHPSFPLLSIYFCSNPSLCSYRPAHDTSFLAALDPHRRPLGPLSCCMSSGAAAAGCAATDAPKVVEQGGQGRAGLARSSRGPAACTCHERHVIGVASKSFMAYKSFRGSSRVTMIPAGPRSRHRRCAAEEEELVAGRDDREKVDGGLFLTVWVKRRAS
jgi:hypothetical protein